MESLGVGNVERNFVVNTTTQLQETNCLQQKTIMMPFVVGRKKDFQRKHIVEVDAQVIVYNVGLRELRQQAEREEAMRSNLKTVRYPQSFQETLVAEGFVQGEGTPHCS